MPEIFSIVAWRKLYTKVGRVFGLGCIIVIGLPLVIGFGWNQYSGSRNSSRQVDTNTVIGTVNGDPITMSQYLTATGRSAGSGEDRVRANGNAVTSLVAAAVVKQLGKKYGVRVSDADVDRRVAEERVQILGKTGTDDEWETFLQQRSGLTPVAFRETVATDPSLLFTALQNKFKANETVTPDDVKKYQAEVRLRVVQIGWGKPTFADPRKPAKTFTESEAKKKAEDLLAEAKGGRDLAGIAKANSTDFTKSNGGLVEYSPEFRKLPSPMGGSAQEQLASMYGTDFAKAVHDTAAGQFTPVVPTSGFGSTGFSFAKVEGRRDSAPAKPDPKNPKAVPTPPDPKKIADDLKTERALDKFRTELTAAVKAARVTFTKAGDEAQAYYDRAKADEMEQAQMMAKFGQPSADKPPTQAEVDAKKAQADAEFLALSTAHPTDPTIALVASGILRNKMALASSAEKAGLRDKLIALYQTALNGKEDADLRFNVGDLLKEKGDLAGADAAYMKISRLKDIAPGFDENSMMEEKGVRKRLVTSLRSINKGDEADAEEKKIAAIDVKIAEIKRKAPPTGAAGAPGGIGSIRAGGASPVSPGSNDIALPANSPAIKSTGVKRTP